MTTDAPLQGLRVLDLTRLLPGPVATLRLAELGADVLKIEEPGAGDGARAMMQTPADKAAGKPSAFYRLVNRGKRETRLDLKTETGSTVLRALVRESHVLVESFRPGVMARLGLDYARLAVINPKLVYCAITGYGVQGPYAQRPGHDINYLAYAGVLDQIRAADGTPVVPNIQIADLLGGAASAVTRILAALWQVSRGGPGTFIDVSMTHAVREYDFVARAMHAGEPASGAMARGRDATATPQPPGHGLLQGGAPCYNVYRTADDRWLAVGALELKFWERLCRALGREDWTSRHWTLGQAIGGPDASALKAELAARFAGAPLATWLELLEPLDCCVSPILTPEEARTHLLFRAPEGDEQMD
ncbi:CaiB/BaiF CoA-transferase family protein [Trinickia caryophylli]|uniref:Crotonobetainyl-CoA:carnitine CoA-transferase CaiB n=1 Tax=Trinickia caryophylli TaxID=28094 RepID=A0A1X7DJ05_TRICW|nr:CaiB/BaiF CoA-transferase family protein [Trinickia caryophylli]WQE12197.1 CaiB/BaiF CoA-transferase family protein [Trinickia caryophylli]GLU31668.1 CoA transferase [Trinickia caryophylli]SMF16524.1 Crotonobetainyl-CoA:carnitine CoA-transferase CaiB [Trinickia caryophylli]